MVIKLNILNDNDRNEMFKILAVAGIKTWMEKSLVPGPFQGNAYYVCFEYSDFVPIEKGQ
jgi:hypothetical protein